MAMQYPNFAAMVWGEKTYAHKHYPQEPPCNVFWWERVQATNERARAMSLFV